MTRFVPNSGTLQRHVSGEAMSITGELARFVTGTSADDPPPRALERARMAIASTIASAAMGADIVPSGIIRELARERGGAPEATVWFDGGGTLPIADAARVNALTPGRGGRGFHGSISQYQRAPQRDARGC